MRLIDADKLMKIYENPPGLNIDNFSVSISIIRQSIQDMPTIESAEVVHGEWIYNVGGRLGESIYYCNKCLEGESEFGTDNYCPNCGAKMDGGKE